MLNCNLQAETVCLIGWQKYLECRHFSLPLKALEAGQACQRRKVQLLFPLAHRSSVNGCGPHDWPELVCIDPAHPTPESAASCRLTPPEESPRQMKTHPAALSLPRLKRLSTYTFIYCLLYTCGAMCHFLVIFALCPLLVVK